MVTMFNKRDTICSRCGRQLRVGYPIKWNPKTDEVTCTKRCKRKWDKA